MCSGETNFLIERKETNKVETNRTMIPTENLIKEHKEINKLLDIMSNIATKIRSKDVFYPTDVEEIIDYLIILIEKSHQGKEDEVFYPALILSGISNEIAPLRIIEDEHLLSKHYLKEISCCVVNCKIGNDFSGELLADSLTKYVTVIKKHIKREEEIVFPMANKVFSVEKQHEMIQKFEDIEEKMISRTFLENFNDLLNKLKSKYPESTI